LPQISDLYVDCTKILLNQVYDSVTKEHSSICCAVGLQEVEQSCDMAQLEVTPEMDDYQLDIFLHFDIYADLEMHHVNMELEGEYFYVSQHNDESYYLWLPCPGDYHFHLQHDDMNVCGLYVHA